MAIPRNLANIAPHVNASSTELVVNDGGANLDFRVEGDTDANMLFVDAGNERVGIGTSSPTSKLDVVKAGNSNGGTIMMSGSKSNNSNKYGNLTGAHYTNDTYTQGVTAIGTLSTSALTIVDLGGGVGEQLAATTLRFWTAADTTTATGTERMRINATGTVLINSTNTTPSDVANIKLNVVGQQMFIGGSGSSTQSDVAKGCINFRADCGSGSNTEAWANYYPGVFMDVVVESGNDGFANSALMIRAQRGGAISPGPYVRFGSGNQGSSTFNQQFRVAIDSGAVANVNGVYGSLSDVRLKQDITDASSQWDDIKAIRVRKFRMKSDFELAETINAANPDTNWEPPYYIGAIAQELEEISPGLIEHEGGEDNFKTIKYSILYMKAIKALQEAMERIETLEAKVATLESA